MTLLVTYTNTTYFSTYIATKLVRPSAAGLGVPVRGHINITKSS